MNFSKQVLKNGTRVVLVPMKDVQTVTVEILVEAGSRYENKKNNGVSHFLEHMMFKGTKKRPTTKKLIYQLDSVGADYNAFTGKEQTGYYIKIPAQHWKRALHIVSDMYFNSLIKAEEIEKERGVILQEAAMYRDTPMRYVWDVFEDLLYGDQPVGWDIIGTEENIKRMKRKDFIDYLSKLYLPQSTVVVVAGNIDEENVLREVESLFSSAKTGKKKSIKKKVKEKQDFPGLKIFDKKTDQTHLLLGFRGPHMFSPERHAAVVLGSVMGGGFSARAFANIREKHGLTYYINSATDMMTDCGYLFMSAGVDHDNLVRALRLILAEFRKIREKKISFVELKKAKEYLKGISLMSLESTNAVAGFFGNQEFYRKKIKPVENLLEKIDSVSADDIMNLTTEMLKNEKLNLAVIGPHRDKRELLQKELRIK